MRHYIFLSMITGAGGVQCYVASKAKYLESQGWHVVVIGENDSHVKEDDCLIEYLRQFLSNGNLYLRRHPCYLPRFVVNGIIERLRKVIGEVNSGEELVIESWNSPTAQWGELLASRFRGRHIFWTANEHFRNYGRKKSNCYEEKIDFFKFKMDRGEIFSSVMSVNKLFEGYWTYREGDFTESPITEDPIQDIKCNKVDAISRADWNICYIGRPNKPYVPNIFKGVGVFAVNHPDKSVNFIIVGEVNTNIDALNSIKNISNLHVIEMGNLFPLPKSLYKKIDVVIAGSGSARHSADEGALVITVDSQMKNSHGLLGYDTCESIYKPVDENSEALNLCIEDALERALVKETWKQQTNMWKRSLDVAECTKIQMEIIANANPELEYYDEKKLLEGPKNYMIPLRVLYGRVMSVLRFRIRFSE